MLRKLTWIPTAMVCGAVLLLTYSRLHAEKAIPTATETKEVDKLPQAVADFFA